MAPSASTQRLSAMDLGRESNREKASLMTFRIHKNRQVLHPEKTRPSALITHLSSERPVLIWVARATRGISALAAQDCSICLAGLQPRRRDSAHHLGNEVRLELLLNHRGCQRRATTTSTEEFVTTVFISISFHSCVTYVSAPESMLKVASLVTIPLLVPAWTWTSLRIASAPRRSSLHHFGIPNTCVTYQHQDRQPTTASR